MSTGGKLWILRGNVAGIRRSDYRISEARKNFLILGVIHTREVANDPDLREILDAIRAAIREEIRASATDEYLTVREAAKLSSLAVPTLRLYIREGKLKARRAGRRVIISRRDLEEFIKNGGENAKA